MVRFTIIYVAVPERLSCMTRNHVAFARAGSNSAVHAFLFILHLPQPGTGALWVPSITPFLSFHTACAGPQLKSPVRCSGHRRVRSRSQHNTSSGPTILRIVSDMWDHRTRVVRYCGILQGPAPTPTPEA
jgi:hypothetical protein